GGGEDGGLTRLKVGNRVNRCENPNCGTTLTNLSGDNWYTRVTFSAGGRQTVINLCQTCSEILKADLASREATARAYLDEARTDLERAARRFPRDSDVESALQQLRKVELLADVEKRRKKKGCFISTAAYGSPLA